LKTSLFIQNHLIAKIKNKKMPPLKLQDSSKNEDQIITHFSKDELANELLAYSKEAIKRLSSSRNNDAQDKLKVLDLEMGKLNRQLEKLNRAVLNGFFDSKESIEQKNKIIEHRREVREQLDNLEECNESTLWKLTAEVINVFNYIPYQYKDLNPAIRINLINLLFLNREQEGIKKTRNSPSENGKRAYFC